MQWHGVKFSYLFIQIFPQLHEVDHNSNAVLHQLQGECQNFLQECGSLLREVILNAFSLIIKHCTKKERGDRGLNFN